MNDLRIQRTSINWGVAFVEFLVVVLGVGSAFAVERWWDEQVERRTEQQYLLGLRHDFEANERRLASAIAFHDSVIDHGRQLAELISTQPETVDRDSLARLLSWTFNGDQAILVTTTYDDLVGSGNLDVISSDSLRRSLAEFNGFVRSRMDLQHALNFELFMNNEMPYLIDHLLVSDFFLEAEWARRGVALGEGDPNRFGIPGSPFQSPGTEILRDRRLWNHVTYRIVFATTLNGAYRNAKARVERILDLVRGQLE